MNRTDTAARPMVRQIGILLVLLSSTGNSQVQEVHQSHRAAGMPGRSYDGIAVPARTQDSDYEQNRPSPKAGWNPSAPPLRITNTYVVTTNADTGVGSLRSAIDSANASPGLDMITFGISGTITPRSPLPEITGPVVINGTVPPVVELNGSLAGTSANGLVLKGGNSTVRGLVINRFGGIPGNGFGFGIVLDVSGGNVIEGNYIGTNVAGTAVLPNSANGVAVIGTSGGNRIGGTTPQAKNVISGNYSGIAINAGTGGGNVIQGNYIGVNASGTAVLGNAANGIFLDAPNDTIGGLVPGARNIISGNAFPGVFVGISAPATVIQGNYIGTDYTGNLDFGNIQNGVYIDRAASTVIGDTSLAGRNVISGNDFPGVYIFGLTAVGTKVMGNFIGIGTSGSAPLGSGNGVIIDGAPFNTIGGLVPGARNIVSGNPFPAIDIMNAGATGNTVVGNYVGTDTNGLSAIGNSKGILINNAPGNLIGNGTEAGRNVISGNTSYGVEIRSAGATGNKIIRNFIGTDVSGSGDLGNGSHGVVISSSLDTVIFNTIAFNHGSGVYDSSGTQNLILGNSIHSNTGLGIDLAPQGLTINDSLDVDTGPNNLQNFPLLDSSRVSGANITIHGRYNGTPNTQFNLDFYSSPAPNASHFGEGETYLNAGYVGVTDAGGNADFAATFAYASTDQFITATARDNAGNTSEFSQALCLSDSDGDGILDSWETQGWGIDVNGDGKIDLDLYALGARPNHKDLFVEVDAMTGFVPPDSALKMVVASFAQVPNAYLANPDGQPGVNLHYVLDDTAIGVVNFPNIWTEFDSVKKIFFGTKAQRDSSNARYILQAKNLVYRYCIFARTFGTTTDDTTSSGKGELANGLGGNDFMVTFGAPNWNATKKLEDNAGTFMHELGHTLGLKHGGDQGRKNYKPNYYSVMNYLWQSKFPWQVPGSWRLDYSPIALPTLIETNLDETVGLNPPVGAYPIIAVPFSDSLRNRRFARLAPATAVDWTGNGDSSSTSVSVDINDGHSPGDTLTGFADWPNVKYNFRNSPDFAPGIRVTPLDGEEPEMTTQDYAYLNSFPLPKPAGRFIMDGQLDTSAVLVGSNAGINLYARYKSGALYVAANSAQSQGADMYIFVSDGQYPLRSAPSGKTGQVAGWTAYLKNKSSDNSAGWYDAAESPLNSITLDSVGALLEGVIDIELLYGKKPANLYIAVGKYGAGAGGALLAQVPAGNGDGNIDANEYLLFTGSPPSGASFSQQGNKLVGTGAVQGSYGSSQGKSVALSADGNTAIVGGYFDNNTAGAVWAFTRSNGVWSQQGSKLVGADAANPSWQGWSVAVSSDGNTAIVGGLMDNHNVGNSNNSGSAWIFTRTGSVWSQQGGRLFDPTARGSSAVFQGYAVSISADGNTALVSGDNDSTNIGAVWVYTRSGTVWTQQEGKLVGTGGVGSVNQGYSAALSGDGNTAIVGGPIDNSEAGAVWIFTRSGNAWGQQGSKLVGTGAVGAAWQGYTVAISSDGNTAIVGGPYDNNNAGAAWIFTRSSGTWSQQGNKLVGTGATGAGATQGTSVAISGDGNTAVIGGTGDNGNAGAVWVFTRSNGTWTQLGGKLVGSGAAGLSTQGGSVAISADGNTAISGGTSDSSGTGAAWIFAKQTALPIQLASFTVLLEPHGHGVLLNWRTLSEINNYGFEVQRSPDHLINFQSLPNSFIPGHGTTSEPHSYSTTDTAAPAGVWRYRLKQIDLDGTFHFGPDVLVNVVTGVQPTQIPKVFALYQNYPNPFNPVTTLRYDVPVASRVSLKVYNMLGQEVATLVNEVQQPGYKSLEFAADRFASGVYFYRITAGKFVSTKKMIMLK